MDDAAVVEVVDKNGADDSDNVVLGKLAFCRDAVKEPSTSGEFKTEGYARLEALVKFDLRG